MRKLFLAILLCLLPVISHAGMGGGKFFLASGSTASNPTLSAVTVGTDGVTYTFTYSAAVQADTTAHLCNAYSLTWTTAGAETLSYSSGTGTSTVTCTGSPTVNSGDTVSAGLNYSSAYIVASSGGASLQSISGKSVTNNSTQGGSSFTAQVTYNGAYYSSAYFYRASGNAKIATKFTVGGTGYTVTKTTAALYKTGSPTWHANCAIFTDSSGAPGTQVGTASSDVITSSIAATDSAGAIATPTAFTGISASVSASTSYWEVYSYVSGTDGGDYANFLNWAYQNNGSGADMIMWWNGSAWVDAASSGFSMPGISVIYSTP